MAYSFILLLELPCSFFLGRQLPPDVTYKSKMFLFSIFTFLVFPVIFCMIISTFLTSPRCTTWICARLNLSFWNMKTNMHVRNKAHMAFTVLQMFVICNYIAPLDNVLALKSWSSTGIACYTKLCERNEELKLATCLGLPLFPCCQSLLWRYSALGPHAQVF